MKKLSSALLFVLMLSLLFVVGQAFAAEKTTVQAAETPSTEAVTTEAVTTEVPTTETATPAVTTEVPTTEKATTESVSTEQPAAEAATKKEVIILHTNDIHGRLDAEPDRVIGMAKVKTIKEQEKPTLMLDAGDVFQGLPISNYSKGEDMAKVLNSIGYDAMTIGNHEFDFGFDQTLRLKEMLNFPMISSNVYKDGKSVFTPSTIINKDGIRFGIVGVTTPETATKTHPNNIKGITFLDPLTTVTKEMTKQIDKVDSYVVLSHLGIDKATQENWRSDYLAQQLAANQLFSDKTIVVIDGHSHSVIDHGILTGNTVLGQTGTALANIGKITFTPDGSTKTAELINVSATKDISGDQDVQAVVDKAKEKFSNFTSEVIINNKVNFQGERDYVRTQETNLGNAITDALEQYSLTGFKHQGDFAVTNGGGIRASIQGNKDITRGDVISVLPFGNTISQIQVKGSAIKEMFEHSLSAPTVDKGNGIQLDANGAFLHVSNSVKVYYDLSKTSGQRVYAVEVYDKASKQYQPLDVNKTYNVVTNDFVAAGGDGYTMLGGPREEGPSLDTVFANFMKTADLSVYDTTKAQRVIAGDVASYVALVTTEEPVITDEPETSEEPVITEEPETSEEPVITEEQETNEEPVIEEEAIDGVLSINSQPAVTLTSTEGKVVSFHDHQGVKTEQPHTDMKPDYSKENRVQLPHTGESHDNTLVSILLLAGAAALYRSRKSA